MITNADYGDKAMIERANIVEELIEEGGRKYFLMVTAEVNDDAGTIEVEMQVRLQNVDDLLAHARVKARISNPIEIIFGYLLHAAAHYGLCVGVHLILMGGEICYEAYQESAKETGKMHWSQRCKDVFSRMKGKSNKAKADTKKALKHCAADAAIIPAIL
jgi:hypothetical protein